jgi:predicted phosphate transport protein (TIGR00153 family)
VFKRFMPREENFFVLFDESADLIVQGAKEFRSLLDDLENLERRTKLIKDIEHKADEVTHATIQLLYQTFITPLDREHIYSLISKMDDILDFIEAASERMLLFDIRKSTPEMVALADICVKSAYDIKSMISGLNQMKKPQEMLKKCVEINSLENEADHVLRSAIAKLFRDEPDTRNLIKYKEIYELLETVTDRCEDVANIVESIVLEYS